MRPLMVVVLHPEPNPLPRLFITVKLRSHEKLLPDCLPEPLDLTQCHRMVRLTAQVVDLILSQFLLEARLTAPSRVLTAIVGEHLLGWTKLRHRCAIDFQHMLRCLAAKQIQPHDVAGMIVDEPDQIRILVQHTHGTDVALP